jgi:hypothetical protein
MDANAREIENTHITKPDAKQIAKIDQFIEYFTIAKSRPPERVPVAADWHTAMLAKHKGAGSLCRRGVALVPVSAG